MQLTTSHSASSPRLSKAILVYECSTGYASQDQQRTSYATIHPVVRDRSGAPVIAPGTPLRREALEASLGDLANGAGTARFRFTDESVIASGPGMTCWYTKAQSRHMVFTSNAIARGGLAAQPAMLWLATGKDLFVFALGDDERPTKDTPVFHAPHFNVWKGGRLCIGTASRPLSLDPACWVRMFYDSAFTHPNDGNTWQVRSRGGCSALWQRLLKEGGKQPFPLAALAPTGANVGQIVEAIMSTGVKVTT